MPHVRYGGYIGPHRNYRYRARPQPGALAVAAVAAAALALGAGHALHHAPAPGGEAAKAIAFARAQEGCPYVWAGTGPCDAGFDCSGLVMGAWASAGVQIDRTSQDEWATLRHVTTPEPGDLVFFPGSDGSWSSPGHVALVTGPHQMIEAYATGFPVMSATFGLPTSLPGTGAGDVIGYAQPWS